MDKNEILEKSRAENKNKDIYEQEVLKQTSYYALLALLILATLFLIVQILTGGGINYGLYALVFCGNMTTTWVKYIKLKQKNLLFIAVLYTLLVLSLSGCHIYNLITASVI